MRTAVLVSFFSSESGAVTVDWTVLTAAIVGLGLTSVAAVRNGTADLGEAVEVSLTNASATSGIMALDGFVFTEHDAAMQTHVLDFHRNKTDEVLLEQAAGQGWQAQEALDAGDLATARHRLERLYISEMVIRERGLEQSRIHAPKLEDLRAAIDAAS
jgi:hypothetical protein